MLEGWYCRTINEEAQQQQNPLDSFLNNDNIGDPPMDNFSSADDDSEDEESGNTNINFKALYGDLKKNVKLLVYENVYFQKNLRNSQKRLLKITRDRSFLLDRLLEYERPELSSSDSDETEESDDSSKAEAPPKKRKVETFVPQSAQPTMKPPAPARRNKKPTKKQQQQQQQAHAQSQQLPHTSVLSQQLPHTVVQPQQHPLMQQSQPLPHTSHDMLDQLQLTPEDRLTPELIAGLDQQEQDKLMELIQQLPQSQQVLHPQQQLPQTQFGPPTQQQLMQSQQQPLMQQQQLMQSQQQLLHAQQQQQVLQHQQQMQLMSPQQQQHLLQQSQQHLLQQSQQQLLQPDQQQFQLQQQQQYQLQQQQLQEQQLEQFQLQQLSQQMLFPSSQFTQQPTRRRNAYQYSLPMIPQVPTDLLATSSGSDLGLDVPGDDVSLECQLTKEELERHLQSRQTMPQVIPEGELPIEMFNNNMSNESNDQLDESMPSNLGGVSLSDLNLMNV
ncbi:bromodomain-containing protein DDB_G0280777-like [Anopheles nili]|uniref:bromodomain-containing protein DDB_G0280777-like n=1 Tax=Anopheles nili TaxID=185578 RepID=UPI00237BEF44|nr:bromodomain-containing protein DDB_G0280777-like [Anopheles nili]